MGVCNCDELISWSYEKSNLVELLRLRENNYMFLYDNRFIQTTL